MTRPTLRSTLAALRADAARYPEGWRRAAGFWCTASYRVRRLRRYGSRWFLLLIPLDIACALMRRYHEASEIPAAADIGAGLHLPHPIGIVVNPRAVIGRHCTLWHNTTVGALGESVARVGDHCTLLFGSALLGESMLPGNTLKQYEVRAGGRSHGLAAKPEGLVER